MPCILALALLIGAPCAWPQPKESTVRLDGAPEVAAVSVTSRFHGYQSAVDRDLTDGAAAYDYSVHIIKDRERGVYRLYSGGRWLRRGVPNADGDHVLQHVSESGGPGTWIMPRDRPEIWKGSEDGYPDAWFADNYLEPEVLRIDGVYHMYTQVQGNPGSPIDIPGEVAVTGADRIQLHTSADGSNWKRRSWERGVIVSIDDPTRTNLHHHEVIHVPWDADGRPFWMYVVARVDGKSRGHVRIRSADPNAFDWRLRERASGMSQLGNQIAYASDAPGGPLFIRITFTADDSGRRVPALQFSTDGLSWFWGEDGPVILDGCKDNGHNRNCYFLGISTLDGTGELERVGDNTYTAVYGAATCSSPIAPDIFHSEIGVGEMTLRILPAGEEG